MKILDLVFKFNTIVENEPQHHLQIDRTTAIRKKVQLYFKRAKYQKLTDHQMFFFLVILSNSLESNSVENINVAVTLSMKRAELIELRYERIVNELINLGYVEIKGRGNHRHPRDAREIGVVSQIYDAVVLDKELTEKVEEVPSLYSVAYAAKNFMQDINCGNTSFGIAIHKLKEIIKKVDSPPINIINNYELEPVELMIYIICIYDYLSDVDHKVHINQILENAFDRDSSHIFKVKKSFVYASNQLFKNDIIRHVSDSEYNSGTVVCLSPRIIDMLDACGDIGVKNKSFKELVKIDDSVVLPKLFYNENIQKEIDKITELIQPDRFKNVIEEFKRCNLPTHFNILMHGCAGSGKTALSKLLCKNKFVYELNASELKSMWFSKSESLVNDAFKRFRAMAEAHPYECVMVLQEADSIISKRLENVGSSTDQTNNSIQNIILGHIETMVEGSFLICTTNNSKAFDDAFARRFAVKLQIDLPDENTSLEILKHYLVGYSDSLYRKMSKLGLSGGFISNISKKVLIHKAINGGEVDEDLIFQWSCEEANFNKVGGSVMGFKAT